MMTRREFRKMMLEKHLLSMWWTLPAYSAKAKRKGKAIMPTEKDAGLFFQYAPGCKHDRTSYDIAHCPECVAFSKAQFLEWLRERNGEKETNG